MSESSFFGWDTNGTGDGTLSGYTETQMQLLLRMLMCGYNTTNLGGVADYLNKLTVTGTATPVAVNTGAALVYGIPYENSASVNVTIPTPASNPRIDRVVLRASWSAQTVRITRIAGTEAASPSAPAMTQVAGTTWDIPLANVHITTGGVITVTDTREWLTVVGTGDIITVMLADDAVTAAKMADYAVDPRTGMSGTNGIVVDPQNGDARGADAVDLQTKRSNSIMVASGVNSVVGGGEDNRASGLYSVVAGGFGNVSNGQASTVMGSANSASGNNSSIVNGASNQAQSDNSMAMGLQALTDKYAQIAHAAGQFAAVGDAQSSRFVLRNSTTNNTPTVLFLNGSSLRLTIATDATWAFSILLVARRTDADNESAAYKFEGCIDNNAGTTALVGSVTKTVLAEDTAAWDADVTADNANDALIITVTGENAKTIRWVALVTTVEVSG